VPDIALAFWEYQLATNDAEFLRAGTWPVLKNIAEWIESRGQFTRRGFEIRVVMGVDESLPSTDHNSFMNLASKMAMEAAIACARALAVPPPPIWERIRDSFFIPLGQGRARGGSLRWRRSRSGLFGRHAAIPLSARPTRQPRAAQKHI
jgi:trehalose/maltose hydrolase-like predicted phosphorylase